MKAPKRVVYIYHLLDEHENCRYVGQTKNPTLRLQQHLGRQGNGRYLKNWIRRQVRSGHPPKMLVVMACFRNWDEAEQREILRQKGIGARLCNIKPGGKPPARELAALRSGLDVFSSPEAMEWWSKLHPATKKKLKEENGGAILSRDEISSRDRSDNMQYVQQLAISRGMRKRGLLPAYSWRKRAG